MKYYVVDAFTDALFHGNPAGVCVLEKELEPAVMQRIASENNLAETAFLLPEAGGYRLRWFTPEVEIDLCGHATLASAYVVMNLLEPTRKTVRFETMSGTLSVERAGGFYHMDFPSRPPKPVPVPEGLEQALGCPVLSAHLSRDLVAEVSSEREVRELRPDIFLLQRISKDISFGVIVTAPGDTCDFVSRFFAPNAGVMEDPVTGSAHSTLIPFWRQRLGKNRMRAKQLSARGGTLTCEACGDRVRIGGEAVLYLQGEIRL